MTDTNARRAAIIIPGLRYGAAAPLLQYASDAARSRGAQVVPISWQPPDLPTPAGRSEWVVACVAEMIDDVVAASPGVTTVLVGKSLGTHAAIVAADRALPSIWLTPLLNDGLVVDALHRAAAPYLLVGGTADELWDGRLARHLSPHVLEIDGADHSMYVAGPLAASAAVLGYVATAIENFLDDVVWPKRAPEQQILTARPNPVLQ